jgi:hypothetical protein
MTSFRKFGIAQLSPQVMSRTSPWLLPKLGCIAEGKKCQAKYVPKMKFYALEHDKAEKQDLWPTKKREVDGNFLFCLSQRSET